MMRGNGLVKVSYSFFSGSRLDGTVVVVTVVVVVPLPPTVVVVVAGVDLGIQIRCFPTRMHTCARPPIVRTAPTRAHLPAVACIGVEGRSAVSNVPTTSVAAQNRWLLLIFRLEPTANCRRSSCR